MITIDDYLDFAEVHLQRFSATKLASLLKQQGISAYALAQKMGVSTTWIQRLLKGEIRMPTDSYLTALAKTLGVSYLALLEDEDTPTDAAAYMAASPYEGVFRVIQAEVRPEEVPAFLDFVRESAEWPASYRGMVLEIVKMIRLSTSPPKKPHVMGKGEE